MKAQKPITVLFLIAAFYDGVLGAAFLLAPGHTQAEFHTRYFSGLNISSDITASKSRW
jgi:hypothetical protein